MSAYSITPNRSGVVNAFVHELGNRVGYNLSGGTTYTFLGVPGAVDDDSRNAFQACVFNEPIIMKQKKKR